MQGEAGSGEVHGDSCRWDSVAVTQRAVVGTDGRSVSTAAGALHGRPHRHLASREPPGRPRRGAGAQRRRRRPVDRADQVRRAARARWRTAAPTRVGRWARDRSRRGCCAVPGTATTTTRRPGLRPARSPSTSTTGCRRTTSRRAPTACGSSSRTRSARRARSPTCWSRPWSHTASTPSSGWSATPTSASPTLCGAPRSGESSASSASATRAPPRSRRAPTAS